MSLMCPHLHLPQPTPRSRQLALNLISVYSDLRPVVKSVRRAGSLPLMWKYWDLTVASLHQPRNLVIHTHTHPWYHESNDLVSFVEPQTRRPPLSVCQVIALYDYTAANSDEMSFTEGQVISVLDKNNPDWWKGELNGVTGLFPTNYVKMTTADSDPSHQCKWIPSVSWLFYPGNYDKQ